MGGRDNYNERVSNLEPEVTEGLERIRRVVGPMGDRRVDVQVAARVAEKVLDSSTKEGVAHMYLFVEEKLWELRAEGKTTETPLQEEEVDYRTAAEVPKTADQFSINLVLTELGDFPGKTAKDKVENLVAEHTQTWLDVAFIQQAVHSLLLQEVDICGTRDVARMVFGDDSRVEKGLELYAKQTARLEAKLALMTGVFIASLVGDAVAVKYMIEKKEIDVFVLVFMLTHILAGIFALLMIRKGWGDPDHDSRMFWARKYKAMEVPEAASRFVQLSFQIHNLLLELREHFDEIGRTEVIGKLTKVMAEAEDLARKNRKVLGELAFRPKAEVIEKKFEDGTMTAAEVAEELRKEREQTGQLELRKGLAASKVRFVLDDLNDDDLAAEEAAASEGADAGKKSTRE